jgi:DNA-binding NarL/FixJ family response regulator
MRQLPPAPVSLVIADDQALIRDELMATLSTIAEVVVIGMARDGAGAVVLAEHYDPDVVLMGLGAPAGDGVQATRALLASRPDTAVIVLAADQDDAAISAVLQAGAVGYLTKDASRREIRSAVRAAASARGSAGPTLDSPRSNHL